MRCVVKIIFIFFLVYILSMGLFSTGSGTSTNHPFAPPVKIRNFSPHDYKAHKENWSVIQDNRGIMYFANSSGVLEFDTIDWRLIPLPQSRAVYSLAKDRQGRIYVGGDREIGFLAADQKGKLQYQSLIEKIPMLNREQEDRIIQVGVISGGVVFLFERLLFILKKDSVKVFTAEDHFYCFIYINQTLYIIDDTRGFLQLRGDRLIDVPGGSLIRAYLMLPFKDHKILILTTQQGPIIFDPAAAADPYYPYEMPDKDFFSSNLISCGLVLDNQSIVLGSIEKGIAVFDPHGRQVSQISLEQGLQDKHVYGIYRDAGGNIWAGLEQGISLLRSPLFKASITPPGAVPFAALIRGCQKLSDDRIVLDGAFYVPDNRVQSSRQQQHQVPAFAYAYNGFRFTFTSNNYEEIEKTTYQCFMEGLDKDWSSWMDRTSREYTNLYWGKYTFRVRAKNYLGEISKEAAYTFQVKPPWHETWWFLAGQIGFILLVLITSRLMQRVGRAQKLSQYMIIFAVIIIFEYFNGFIGPIIGRYSDGIAFFGMLMTGVLSIIISPAQDFILELMKKIIRGRE